MRARFNFGVQAAASLPAQQSTPRGVSSGRNGDSAALFQLNTRGLLIHVLLLFALWVSFYLVPASLSVVYWLLCPVALVSPRMALQALVFAACVRYLNPGLFTFGGNIGLASWATLLCAAGRALMSFRPQSLRIMAPIWLFGLVAFATSSVASSFVGVSVMKLLSFLLGASTAIMCACALSRQERAALTTWLAALLVVIVLASLLTLFMPAIAHFRGAGFQGILNHPQSLGALMAPFVSWLLASIYLQHRSLVSPYLFVAVLFVVIDQYGQRGHKHKPALNIMEQALCHLRPPVFHRHPDGTDTNTIHDDRDRDGRYKQYHALPERDFTQISQNKPERHQRIEIAQAGAGIDHLQFIAPQIDQ